MAKQKKTGKESALRGSAPRAAARKRLSLICRAGVQ